MFRAIEMSMMRAWTPPYPLKAFWSLGNGVGSLKKLGHARMKRGQKETLQALILHNLEEMNPDTRLTEHK